MLFTSDRMRPCRARFWRSSLGRSTINVESSWRTVISPGRARASVPCGPFTVTRPLLTCTSTPLGIAIGERPILLIALSPSPHVTEDLAAHATAVRLSVGHESLTGRQHGHTQPTEDPRQPVGGRVN